MYIDVHCHLDMLKNIDEIIKNAKKKNVNVIVSAGVDIETNRKTLELSEKFQEVRACLGIYPDEALKMSDKEIDSEIEFINKNKEKVWGIGEVGMDFSGNDKDNEKQERVFEKFIELSKKLDKPIVVHSRKAEEECIEVLEKLKAKKVVMHYFSGRLKLVERIVNNGWMLSIPTAVKNSEHFQKVVEIVPIENLLCETDSPYSHPDKKFPNEPANVVESYKMIAKIKGLGLNEVEEKIEKNFERLVK
ncbi:deoxyribonuclease [Candidatus Pacearchaeota archaeon CG10_big_fil_rev_8_21_14_0_10_34_76]|nr:MAG: deoxyribonuclease [Candidatus Pacearchaeota archaeon CG10_big_fil_rev_8_21_14_0_10_34_76]